MPAVILHSKVSLFCLHPSVSEVLKEVKCVGPMVLVLDLKICVRAGHVSSYEYPNLVESRSKLASHVPNGELLLHPGLNN